MIAPFRAFKNPVILEKERHKDLKVRKPSDYSFMKEVDIVPLGFSEILSATMYFPVIFGVFEGEIFPFAVLGINGKNVFLNEENFFKVDVVPKVAQVYPFGVIKQNEDWIVIVDEEYLNKEEGEFLFEDEDDSVYLKSTKAELTELAFDFQKTYEFCKEIYNAGCLRLTNFKVETKIGDAEFKNVFIGNIENLSKLQPEKLYYLNISGYLPIIYAIYFSIRNFKLFDLIS